MKNLPSKHDIVKCIKDVTLEYVDYRDVTRVFNYKTDDIYVVTCDKLPHSVSIRALSEEKDHNGKLIESNFMFVDDDSIFEGYQYDKYFTLHKKGSDIKLWTAEIKKDRNSWSSYWEKETRTAKDEYSFKLNGESESFDFNCTKKLKVYEYVQSVSISGDCRSDKELSEGKKQYEFLKDDIVLHSNVKSFSFHSNQRRRNEQNGNSNKVKLDISLPKNLDILCFTNVEMQSIKTKASRVKLDCCKIEKLEIDLSTIEVFSVYGSDIENINVTRFITHTNGDNHRIEIYRISEDLFLTTFSDKKHTKEEITVICNTMQLKDAIEFFKLDTVEFYFPPTWRDEKPNLLEYHIDDKLNIRFYAHEDMIRICSINYCHNYDFFIMLDTENNIKVYSSDNIRSYNMEEVIMTNDLCNRLAKFSEHPQLPNQFFKRLFSNKAVAKLRNTGKIDIRDFDFSMLDDHETYKDCECLIFKNKVWNISKKLHSRDRSESPIQWAKLGFELKTENIKEGSIYVRPGIKDYYEKLSYKVDEFYLLHNKHDFLEYDESIVYEVDRSQDLITKENLHLYKCNLYGIVTKEFRDANTYVDARGWPRGGNFSVPIDAAIHISKKLGFKLNPSKVSIGGGDSGKNTVYTEMYQYSVGYSHKCKTDNEIILLFYYNKFGDPIHNNPVVQRLESPLINIGGKLCIRNEYNGGSDYDLCIVGESIKATHADWYNQVTESSISLLAKNDFKYSYVNLDIPKKLRTDIMNFLAPYEKRLYWGTRIGYTQKLVTLFYRLAYCVSDIDSLINRNNSDDEKLIKITKQMEEQFLKIQEELKKCFEKTKKRIKNGKIN